MHTVIHAIAVCQSNINKLKNIGFLIWHFVFSKTSFIKSNPSIGYSSKKTINAVTHFIKVGQKTLAR